MSIQHRIWNFPTFAISKQLFHVPGSAVDGGFTVGGVSIMSPEPGGRSVLELQPSWQFGEWEYPLSSWIMSKTNGQIMRIRLAPTPQVSSARHPGVHWDGGQLWSNQGKWAGDELTALFVSVALEGSNTVIVDLGGLGELLKPGHVIGHKNNCYLIDEVEYNNGFATIVVTPPFRKSIAFNDIAYLRPFFIGTIANGQEIKSLYDASNAGAIQLEKIVFNEAIV